MSRIATILCLFTCVSLAWAKPAPKPQPSPTPQASRYDEGKRIATLAAPFIDECSGIAVSQRNPGVIWSHNDSGDGPFLYAFDRTGATRGVYRLALARAVDWEDMAAGPDENGKGRFLYIGDIGDNGAQRNDTVVYRIPEPVIGTEIGSKEKPLTAPGPLRELRYRYPDGPHNAETLLVHPGSGDIYIVTKAKDGVSGVYAFPRESLSGGRQAVLRRVGTVRISGEEFFFPNLVTGGDISPDGRRVVLRTYVAAYEWALPKGAKSFDAIWQTKPTMVPLPPMMQGEAIAYTLDGKSLLTTSEMTPTPLYELKGRP